MAVIHACRSRSRRNPLWLHRKVPAKRPSRNAVSLTGAKSSKRLSRKRPGTDRAAFIDSRFEVARNVGEIRHIRGKKNYSLSAPAIRDNAVVGVRPLCRPPQYRNNLRLSQRVITPPVSTMTDRLRQNALTKMLMENRAMIS